MNERQFKVSRFVGAFVILLLTWFQQVECRAIDEFLTGTLIALTFAVLPYMM